MRKKIKWNPPADLLEKGYPPELTGGSLNGDFVVFPEQIINGEMISPRICLSNYSDLEALVDKLIAEEKEAEAKSVEIRLSSRGWGDYSPCTWIGDITRPDEEILAECRDRLLNGHDVDLRDQTDEEILAKISAARQEWITRPARLAAAALAREKDLQDKIDNGYCFNCESYCQGACDNPSYDPRVYDMRMLREAMREDGYGSSDL